MTQEQLAEQLNVARQTISKWETGETIPDIDSLKKLAVLLDFSIDNALDVEIGNDNDDKKGRHHPDRKQEQYRIHARSACYAPYLFPQCLFLFMDCIHPTFSSARLRSFMMIVQGMRVMIVIAHCMTEA